MNALLEAASTVCLLGGALFCLAGGIGLLRMPDFYTRVHAGGVIDTMGSLLVLAGLALHSGFTLATVKLAMVALLILLTGPTAAHALGSCALARGVRPLIGKPGQ